MNKVIDKGFRSCRFVSTIVKHPAYILWRINFYWKITNITQQPIQNAWDCLSNSKTA